MEQDQTRPAGPDGDGAQAGGDKTPLLEWIASAIGLVLTLGILGVIGNEALSADALDVPAIEVTVERIVPTPAGYVVEVTASNRSGATAADVVIEGELSAGGEPVETGTTTLDYVPAQSDRMAGLFFTEDPRSHQLEVRALGYTTP